MTDLGRMAARRISKQLESLEAAEPDSEYRGPASIGDMLGLALKIGLGCLLLFFILVLVAMRCGGPGACSL